MKLPPVATAEERELLRARIDADLADEPDRAEGYRALLAADVSLFVSLFATTFDPRLTGEKVVPFVPFGRQRELLTWIGERETNREDGVVEKSREVGATWTCAAFAAHRFVFDPGSKVMFGSRKESLVDSMGDPDAILEKVRLILRNLPAWVLPPDAWRSHHLKIIGESGATITGEAGDNIGRGGRASLVFVDEAAFLPHPDVVEGALASTATSVIWVSTPAGYSDWFHRRCQRGPTFRFHWRDDPRKDDAWFAEQKAKLDPVVLAREVEIDHAAARANLVVEPAWVEASRKLRGLLAERGFVLPSGAPVVAGLDVGLDRDLSVYVARRGPIVERVIPWRGGREADVAERALALADEDDSVRLAVDAIGLGRGVAERLEDAADRRRREARREEPDDPADAALRRELLRTSGCAGTREVEGFELLAVNVGTRASEAPWPDGARAFEKFANLRSELWFTLRDLLSRTADVAAAIEAGELDPADLDVGGLLLLPDDPDLARELVSLSWFERNGRVVIEAKEALRRRGVPSPDRADALCLTFAPSTRGAFGVAPIVVM